MEPKKPLNLPPLATEILERLSSEPLSANLVLGGGIALKHYDDFRETDDIDAWWLKSADSSLLELIESVMNGIAVNHELILEQRHFGTVHSYELKTRENVAVFSFQVALRDVTLESAISSPWPPILIETFNENIGSKMNALVNRGAPRDFLDIFAVNNHNLITPDKCWQIWELKNPGGNLSLAKNQVLGHLLRIELKRPIELLSGHEHASARQLRSYFKDFFLSQ